MCYLLCFITNFVVFSVFFLHILVVFFFVIFFRRIFSPSLNIWHWVRAHICFLILTFLALFALGYGFGLMFAQWQMLQFNRIHCFFASFNIGNEIWLGFCVVFRIILLAILYRNSNNNQRNKTKQNHNLKLEFWCFHTYEFSELHGKFMQQRGVSENT